MSKDNLLQFVRPTPKPEPPAPIDPDDIAKSILGDFDEIERERIRKELENED